MSNGLTDLHEIVARVARLLPAQGPIASFVHHNTLHGLEHLAFDDAVATAAAAYDCAPYLSEDAYRTELERGRIRREDLESVLRDDLGDDGDSLIVGTTRRGDLRLAMLLDPVRLASDAELDWLVKGSDALRKFRRRCSSLMREDLVADTRRWLSRELRVARDSEAHARRIVADMLARLGERRVEHWRASAWEELTLTLLWRVCHERVAAIPSAPLPRPVPPRPRDSLYAATGEDPDLLVHGVLTRFCAAFADQGLADWKLPGRDLGFWHAFTALYGRRGIRLTTPPWLAGLAHEVALIETDGLDAAESVERSLRALGITDTDREVFIRQSLLALRGWAGMLWQLETRPDRVARPVAPGTLLEFLAVRLLLDRLALEYVARQTLGTIGPVAELQEYLRQRVGGVEPAACSAPTTTQRTFLVFLLAQSLGWTPRALFDLRRDQWEEILREIESFSSLERRRIFHMAYERRYRIHALDALAAHQTLTSPRVDARPSLQVVCCIDEREESLRRHIEEGFPDVETFGTAGFFGVAMYYAGIDDAHPIPLCPAALRPDHLVRERVAPADRKAHERRSALSRRVGRAALRVHSGSRGFALGVLTTLLGTVAALPLVSRVLFPRLAARLRRRTGRIVRPRLRTALELERSEDPAGESLPTSPDAAQPLEGFAPPEMAQIVRRLLEDAGLARRLSRLVVLVGHGSKSLNNPHESAHDCGACGGGRGGPNARAVAQMANRAGVREILATQGLRLPADTVFLGAYHDTCSDSVEYFDVDALPTSHAADLRRLQTVLEQARRRNAQERCRRFQSAPLSISPPAALRHVEARSEDLSQPRPEYGHATNAICVVGRRARTRGLFMDRRAFLVSYDPESEESDADSPILRGVLDAVVPVCAGINLEYYFSFVDPTGWGCGTKLPHNIAALLGVMDGSAGDLRPGLPWQMVEIHEPVRLLLVVEATPDVVDRVLDAGPGVGRLCRNGWVQLATLDPRSNAIHVLRHGRFEPYTPESLDLPQATSSASWYGGLREHLEFASIRTSATATRRAEGAV